MHMHVYASSSACQRFPFKAVLLSPRWSPHGCCTQAAGQQASRYIGCRGRSQSVFVCACAAATCGVGLVCSPGTVIHKSAALPHNSAGVVRCE